jgi:uncharacterized protein (DUF169 family)
MVDKMSFLPMKSAEEYAQILEGTVGLASLPVGVTFVKTMDADGDPSNDHRLCQAIMEARKGKRVLIHKDNISCPAAAAALGLKPLPKQLQDGTMLCGYGIFKTKDAAIRVMETMPHLKAGQYAAVEVKPLREYEVNPDVVVLEDEVEKLMWVALAYLNEAGGRLDFSTSILQAACVDSVVLPFLSGRINMSFGCYGCRDATDAATSEALLGFPGRKLPMVSDNLIHLKSQAIDRSRAKNVYKAFTKRTAASEPEPENRRSEGDQ